LVLSRRLKELCFWFFERIIFIGSSVSFFGTLSIPPMEAPLWTPKCKIVTTRITYHSVYINDT
jgi:hypothetical protein